MSLHIGKYETAHPGDISDLRSKLNAFDPERIDRLALLAKTEGSATINDFSREYALLSASLELKDFGDATLLDRTSLLFSMGSDGAYTPFGYYFIRTLDDAPLEPDSKTRRLVMGMARSRPILDKEVGTLAHIQLVTATVEAAVRDAGLSSEEVGFVIVKNPVAAIPRAIADQPNSNRRVTPTCCRAIGGLGAGIALNEIDRRKVSQDTIARDHSLYARRAMVFSGAEVDYVDVIAFGNQCGARSELVVHSGQVADILDGKSIRRVLLEAGCELDEYGDLVDPDQVVSFFLKIGIAPDGCIRGSRTTIRTSHVDMDYTIRATATGLAHSILGTTRTFISADTVHQAAPGGGLCACIVKAAL